MAIDVTKHGDRYHVSVSPPEGPPWRSREPLTATQVLTRLSAIGCHSTDVTDALTAADPKWTVRHDQEVGRLRNVHGVPRSGD